MLRYALPATLAAALWIGALAPSGAQDKTDPKKPTGRRTDRARQSRAGDYARCSRSSAPPFRPEHHGQRERQEYHVYGCRGATAPRQSRRVQSQASLRWLAPKWPNNCTVLRRSPAQQ